MGLSAQQTRQSRLCRGYGRSSSRAIDTMGKYYQTNQVMEGGSGS